ncbi:hypothetical protein SAMN06272737_11799 [Blastococcus mobilis]|uniref:Uncharacterized protein n=1 Tax=Blastococcus mobilis TaxID=1938746 RepID=A0A238Y3U0_9ACTN|nr:hypothetical protein SAMN06272737_11799 [Blastococcus mobilis]
MQARASAPHVNARRSSDAQNAICTPTPNASRYSAASGAGAHAPRHSRRRTSPLHLLCPHLPERVRAPVQERGTAAGGVQARSRNRSRMSTESWCPPSASWTASIASATASASSPRTRATDSLAERACLAACGRRGAVPPAQRRQSCPPRPSVATSPARTSTNAPAGAGPRHGYRFRPGPPDAGRVVPPVRRPRAALLGARPAADRHPSPAVPVHVATASWRRRNPAVTARHRITGENGPAGRAAARPAVLYRYRTVMERAPRRHSPSRCDLSHPVCARPQYAFTIRSPSIGGPATRAA